MSSLDELDIYIPHAVIEIVASLDKEIDQLRADAERYRWLRGGPEVPPHSTRWPRATPSRPSSFTRSAATSPDFRCGPRTAM